MTTNVPSKGSLTPAYTMRLPDIVGLGGAVAGLGAGIAMAIVAAIVSLVAGNDIWLESKQIAAMVFGGAAVAHPGFLAGPVIVGTLLHFIIAIGLGAVFGMSMRWLGLPSDFGVPIVAGLIYGFAIWIIGYFIVLPLVNPYLLSTYAPAFIVQHLVYGSVLGLLYNWLRPRAYQSIHDDLDTAG